MSSEYRDLLYIRCLSGSLLWMCYILNSIIPILLSIVHKNLLYHQVIICFFWYSRWYNRWALIIKIIYFTFSITYTNKYKQRIYCYLLIQYSVFPLPAFPTCLVNWNCYFTRFLERMPYLLFILFLSIVPFSTLILCAASINLNIIKLINWTCLVFLILI